jgi:hypothetical protein
MNPVIDFDKPVSFKEVMEIKKNLTEPDKVPLYMAPTNYTCSIPLSEIRKIIDLEISKIPKKYDKMRLTEIQSCGEHEFSPPHKYNNTIAEITVENIGLFHLNINVRFNPTEEEKIIFEQYIDSISIERYLNIKFAIIIYTQIKDESYVIEINRLRGDKVKFFYSIWDSLKESLVDAEKI